VSFRLAWRDAIRDDRDLSWKGKLIAHTLASRMNGEGECNPGVATVARDASLSARAVQIGLRELEAFGYLDSGEKKGGAGRSNEYRALLPSREERAHRVQAFQAREQERRTRKGARDAAKRVHRLPEKGARRAPEPVKNPKTNPDAVEDSAVAPSSTARAIPLSHDVAASSSPKSDGPRASSVVEQIEQLRRAALTRGQAGAERGNR
jgi:hypothetical protein